VVKLAVMLLVVALLTQLHHRLMQVIDEYYDNSLEVSLDTIYEGAKVVANHLFGIEYRRAK